MNLNDEWYTPPWVLDRIRNVIGDIDLDPASSLAANTFVKARKIFTIEDNGLNQEWHGTVFLNPPYSASLIRKFLIKAVEEFESGRACEMLILTNSGTDTIWNSLLSDYYQAYTRGRLSFIDGKTLKPRGAGYRGQCLTYLGPNYRDFILEFKDDGFWIPNLKLIYI